MTSDSYVQRARALIAVNRFTDALDMARQGLTTSPKDPVLHRIAALALLEIKEYRTALEHCSSAIKLGGAARDYALLGQILSRLGRRKEGVAAQCIAVSMEPTNAFCYQALTEGLIKLGWSKRIGRRRLFQEAYASAQTAMEVDPANAASHLVMAKAALALGRRIEAAKFIRSGLAIQPDNAVGHQLLGEVARLRGDLRAASEHLVTAAKANPRSSSSIKMLRKLPSGGVVLAGY